MGLIGSVDRLTYPDLGLYPNDYGQAPTTGIDENRVWARVHAQLHAGDVSIAPYADARYSIEQAVLDRADAGVRVQAGDHVVEPSLGYFYPTFDGDSIFNAFSIEPTTDARLAYQFAPLPGPPARPPRCGCAATRVRRRDSAPQYAGGGDAALERALGDSWRGRIDALADTGYGGTRAGGTAELARRHNLELCLRGR